LRKAPRLLVPVVTELIIFAALLGLALISPTSGSLTNTSVTTNAGSTSNNSTVYMTIYESDRGAMAGMNGSVYKGATANWPVVSVKQGQTVVIRVENLANESSEPHGFVIDHYFNSPVGNAPAGVELYPGQSYTVKFVATQTGTFKMYCSVFCTIHPFMQNGELIVRS
jgi:FtsP/CotA-like multicopper oxidase with cupredoxin domain